MTAAGSGTWLLTLRLGFENVRLRETQGTERATDYGSKSKEFLDAKWILGGKAIIALLTNGEWGVWDVEGVAPAVKGSEHLAGLRPRTGIRGGARTTWTLSGRIDKIQTAPQLLDKARQENGASLAFAPRTPRTRRSEEQLLFSGSSIGSRDRARGCIAVQPISKISSKPASSETVLFWYENTISVIPDMRSFWKYQLAKSIAAEEDHIPRLDGKGEMSLQVHPLGLRNVHRPDLASGRMFFYRVDIILSSCRAGSGSSQAAWRELRKAKRTATLPLPSYRISWA
ncbi:MAG: hypothetical protein M1826_006539 [Phylliscum demangeonii]|nr:MAG: hypothetical protein M1826_006539 [Phylliscum demangeonii]